MQHFYESIQGWFYYQKLYASMVEAATMEKPLNFVELGCWKGKSTAFMGVEIVNSGKPITFYAIDWFQGSPEEGEHANDPEIASLYQVFLNNMKPLIDALGDRFVVLKETTVLAAEAFADKSVHFVMVDAGHTAEAVEADIRAWWPKLAVGGVMGGDDWRWPTVRAGVRAALDTKVGRECSPITVLNKGEYPFWMVQKIDTHAE